MPATKSYGYFMRSPDFSASKNTVSRKGALLRMVRHERCARGGLVETCQHRRDLARQAKYTRLLRAHCGRSSALISQFPEVFNHRERHAALLDVLEHFLSLAHVPGVDRIAPSTSSHPFPSTMDPNVLDDSVRRSPLLASLAVCVLRADVGGATLLSRAPRSRRLCYRESDSSVCYDSSPTS